jgi:hypothetical protein
MLPDAASPGPASLMMLLAWFGSLFTAPSFRTFCGLACGFLAQAGRRTVCGMLAGAGRVQPWPVRACPGGCLRAGAVSGRAAAQQLSACGVRALPGVFVAGVPCSALGRPGGSGELGEHHERGQAHEAGSAFRPACWLPLSCIASCADERGGHEPLIRRSGQVVQDRPSPVVGWADIPKLSTCVGRRPAAWQQCWQQSRRNGFNPRPSAFQAWRRSSSVMTVEHDRVLSGAGGRRWLPPLLSSLLSGAGPVRSSST